MADKTYRFVTLTYQPKYWQWSAKEQIRNLFYALENKLFRGCYNRLWMGIELTEQGIIHAHLFVDCKRVNSLKLWVKAWKRFGYVSITEPRRAASCRDYCIKDKLDCLALLYGTLPAPEYVDENNIDFYTQLVGPPGEEIKTIDQYFPCH